MRKCYKDKLLGVKVHCYPVRPYDELISCQCGDRVVSTVFEFSYGAMGRVNKERKKCKSRNK